MNVDLDPVPQVTAGVQTVNCTECPWEAVYIWPEEAGRMLANILRHLGDHGLKLPIFTCTQH